MPVDPSTLVLQFYPEPVLRKKAKPLPAVTDEVRAVAARMIEMMDEEEGIGLAAPQVGLPWRLFVVHVPETEARSADAVPPTATKKPTVYINPTFSNPLGPVEASEEGCLSLPDIRGEVLRPTTITITALGLDGKPFTQTATGLLARCWQHEFDHLDGTLIIDKMKQIDRLKNRSAVRDLERDFEDAQPARRRK